MGLWKWVESGLKIATSWVPGLGTAIEEGLDHWNERLERKSALASLLDLAEHTWRPDSSPAALLCADFGVVPFHGRSAEIEDLASWCDDDSRLTLRLYTAAGGFGKTRLLRHFVHLRREAGWDAGFLPEGVLRHERAAALFGELKKPLLLVLDYAESRRGEIEAVVSSARSSSRERVRVVLLSRSEGDWWAELQRSGDGVGDFFQGPAVPAPIPLLPLTDSIEARQDSYRRAVHAFAEALGKSRDGAATAPAPALDAEDFERVLLVHTAALAAVEGEQVPSGDLLDWLLLREQRGIERVREKQAGLAPELQRAVLHAAALVTLAQGADSRAETVEIIRRAPSLADQPRVRLDRIGEALHVLYRGRRWCDGVEPDLVGEHLVWRALTDAPELLGAAFGEGVPEARLEAGLTVLNRLAQRQPEARSLLSAAMKGGLARLALPAVRVAVAGGDPIGLVLAEALAREPNVEIARNIERHLPHPTTALREAAAQVYATLLSKLRRLDVEEVTVEILVDAARWANNFSNWLSGLGRPEEALEAIEQAVQLYRGLARWSSHVFLPDVAMSLNNLSTCLATLGRWEEALEAIQQAVEIRREFAQSQPASYSHDLALSLNNLSHCLATLGRREEALSAIEEAVEIYGALAFSRSDSFRGYLAASLTHLSNCLAALSRQEEALERIQQAVKIRCEIAHSQPDAFQPDFALSLNNLSLRLGALGRREEALDAIQQAVEIRRRLASARPDAFRPDLALSLNIQSHFLAGLGRGEASLGAIQEAVDIRRDLARSRPDAFRPDLVRSLGALHERFRELGQNAAALETITEALDLLEPLFQKLPRAFASLMGDVALAYERAGEAAGVETDQDRLRSIRQALQSVQDPS